MFEIPWAELYNRRRIALRIALVSIDNVSGNPSRLDTEGISKVKTHVSVVVGVVRLRVIGRLSGESAFVTVNDYGVFAVGTPGSSFVLCGLL